MPRVALTDLQRAEQYKKKVKAEILLQLDELHITKTSMAETLGMSKQSFGYCLKNMTFDVAQMYLIRKKLHMEEL